jgi:hypothetical protein
MRKLACLAVLGVVLSQTGARATLSYTNTTLDPADIHVNGPGGFAQSAGGTDWVTLPTFNGDFNVEDISNTAGLSISPWTLVIAVPNFTGTLGDTITKIGTTAVSISAGPEVTLTGGSAYDALLGPHSGLDASVSFTNFQIADQAVVGGPAPTSYGLYSFAVTPASLALLDKVAVDVNLSGTLPAGSILFAYGAGNDGKEYATAFTNAGVVTPFATSVPEPSSTLMSVVAVGLLSAGYAWRRRRATA